ncbi:histone-lysine n-methyltransferase setd1 [Anaeramoeba flamelloides]|uniref:[histone H3]-lysine(4) N-trimethyltransferase n=1 Tax=Anaeramoeba flamelloides TaxID=1746091 RepID=A0ABQ8YLL6_9EUKA|nr:histone-lysine n-methyltransferase setd1 [Anaeramoeba flamelloides]
MTNIPTQNNSISHSFTSNLKHKNEQFLLNSQQQTNLQSQMANFIQFSNDPQVEYQNQFYIDKFEAPQPKPMNQIKDLSFFYNKKNNLKKKKLEKPIFTALKQKNDCLGSKMENLSKETQPNETIYSGNKRLPNYSQENALINSFSEKFQSIISEPLKRKRNNSQVLQNELQTKTQQLRSKTDLGRVPFCKNQKERTRENANLNQNKNERQKEKEKNKNRIIFRKDNEIIQENVKEKAKTKSIQSSHVSLNKNIRIKLKSKQKQKRRRTTQKQEQKQQEQKQKQKQKHHRHRHRHRHNNTRRKKQNNSKQTQTILQSRTYLLPPKKTNKLALKQKKHSSNKKKNKQKREERKRKQKKKKNEQLVIIEIDPKFTHKLLKKTKIANCPVFPKSANDIIWQEKESNINEEKKNQYSNNNRKKIKQLKDNKKKAKRRKRRRRRDSFVVDNNNIDVKNLFGDGFEDDDEDDDDEDGDDYDYDDDDDDDDDDEQFLSKEEKKPSFEIEKQQNEIDLEKQFGGLLKQKKQSNQIFDNSSGSIRTQNHFNRNQNRWQPRILCTDEKTKSEPTTNSILKKDSGRSKRADIRDRKSKISFTESGALSFNQLNSREKKITFTKSKIHNWGLITKEPITKGDFVVEYLGGLIRHRICEERELVYRQMGIGDDYMFDIEDGLVVDATMCGGDARFINHSCDPNCEAKIIEHQSQLKIAIYAKRDIKIDEEISFDYQFSEEADNEKIPCCCGSSNCRGFLN